MDAIRSSLLICLLWYRGSGRQVVDEGDLRGGSKIGSAVAGVGVVGAILVYTGSMSSLTPSALMIHEIDLTVKIWLAYGRDEEPAKHTILFDVETARTPLPGVPTVNRISSVVLRGVSHEGRLIGGGVRNQEPDGDTRRRDSDLDRFGPSDRRNTLRLVSLVYCIEI